MRVNGGARLQLRAKQVWYWGLSLVFGFDGWHYRVVRENCGYFAQVAALHDALRPDITVEVGCGLGEILTGLRSARQIGIDRDPGVLRAARFLRGAGPQFILDSEPIEPGIPENASVCLLFLNLLHAYAPSDVQRMVGDAARRTRASHIIFDVIRPGVAGYRFTHRTDVLGELGGVKIVVDGGDAIRNLVLVECPR